MSSPPRQRTPSRSRGQPTRQASSPRSGNAFDDDVENVGLSTQAYGGPSPTRRPSERNANVSNINNNSTNSSGDYYQPQSQPAERQMRNQVQPVPVANQQPYQAQQPYYAQQQYQQQPYQQQPYQQQPYQQQPYQQQQQYQQPQQYQQYNQQPQQHYPQRPQQGAAPYAAPYVGQARGTTPLNNNGYGAKNDYEMNNLKAIDERTGIWKYLPVISPAVQQKIEKYLCCCCPKSKKGRLICGGVTLVVLIVLIVILYIFIPRYPEIRVYGIDLSQIGKSGSAYSFTFKDPNVKDLNTMNFKMNMSMSLGTYNPNPYDLSVDEINLSAFMNVNQTVVYDPQKTYPLTFFSSILEKVPVPKNIPVGYYGNNNSQVGSASYGKIVFPSKGVVNFTMTFLLDYTPDQTLGLLNDPTIREIASVCRITDRTGKTRPMRIGYNAQSVIGALKPIGFIPTLSATIGINCPFSPAQIDAVVKNVQNGQDVMTALQTVFGGGAGSVPPPVVQAIPDTPTSNSGSNSGSSGSGSGGSSSAGPGGNTGDVSTNPGSSGNGGVGTAVAGTDVAVGTGAGVVATATAGSGAVNTAAGGGVVTATAGGADGGGGGGGDVTTTTAIPRAAVEPTLVAPA
ncbi:hypothetical protein HDU99_004952 [Rhizoclosmatium hyalinum]|nr:hypothetical protein HDU99_004952 [Rhizoclosmatium hyalinum]